MDSIMSDLMRAQFEADALAARLAERYRDDATMRHLSVPTLSMSNVSLELRLAFDAASSEPDAGPSDAQQAVIEATVEELVRGILSLNEVTDTVSARRRPALSRLLRSALIEEAAARVHRPPGERQKALVGRLNEVLRRYEVALADEGQRLLRRWQEAFEARLAEAPPPSPQSVPGVIVDAEALANVAADKISTLRFDIELVENQWVQTDGDGEPRWILTER